MTDSISTGQASSEANALQTPPLPQSNWALFLDIDGTLLDIADAPDRVQVPARLLDDLQTAEKKLSGALALVSGRPISEIDKLFDPLKLAPAASMAANGGRCPVP